MRRLLLLFLITATIFCAGCHKRTLSDFKLKAGMTAQDYDDQVGSPTRDAGNWVGYALADGSELRLYFLAGARGTVRTLSEADVYSPNGVRLNQLFNLNERKPSTQPTTNPTTEPATAPTTAP